MEVRDLRIKNSLFLGDVLMTVSAIYKSHFTCQTEEGIDFSSLQHRFTGIPLTEEWLVKFGFEKSGAYFTNHKNPTTAMFGISLGDDIYNVWIKQSVEQDVPICFISCVHQLQNLFYSLTGAELTTDKK